MTVGPLHLDLTNRRVLREGKEISLTPTEFTLLEYLMRYAGQVVTRKMLCEQLWEADWEGVTNVVEVHINRLRGKVDRGFAESLIQTVRGRGYVLRARLSRLPFRCAYASRPGLPARWYSPVSCCWP